MYKKIISGVMSICMLSVFCIPTSVFAEENNNLDNVSSTTSSYTDEITGDTIYVTSDGFEYNIINDSEINLIRYTGDNKDLTIPETIDGFPVVSIINTKAFISDNDIIEEVTFPPTIKEIKYAFKNCPNLKKVNLNEGLEDIDVQNFYNCNNLKEIIIPSTVKNISNLAFDWAYLKEISIYNPEFSDKNCFSDIEIEDDVKVKCYENTELYTYCKNINIQCESLGIYTPSDFKLYYKIKDDDTVAITGCNFKNITEINIPETIDGHTVTYVGGFSFAPFLEKVTMPDTVTSLGKKAFYSCDNLKSIKLSKNITEMPTAEEWGYVECNDSTILNGYAGAFEYCYNLEKIIVPSSMTYLDYDTFNGCGNLKQIIVPASITEIADIPNSNKFHSAIVKNDDLTIYTYPNADAVIKFAEKREIPYKFVGDISGKGYIDSSDALALLQNTTNTKELTDEQTEICDFYCDGQITSADALRILQYSVGLINSLY